MSTPNATNPTPDAVALMIFDVDGVLTDGTITYFNGGDESKNFHTQDGLGLRAAITSGLKVAVVTARQSDLVDYRMSELGVHEVVQGCKDKAKEVARLAEALGVPLERAAYLGDDLVDLPAMERVGYPMAVADAAPEVRDAAVFVTARPGGRGAAREAVEHVLRARGKWDAVVAAYRRAEA
ncbi:MAG: HAD hydrolase family protein [Planctomycetota bacterium]